MRKIRSVLKTCMVLGLGLLMVAGAVQAEERLKPFVLASTGPGTLEAKAQEVKEALKKGGFEVIGEYSPYENAIVIVATNDALKAAARKTPRGAYGAVVRVGVTRVGDQIQVAYANPRYFQYAYRMDADLTPVAQKLGEVLGHQKEFGSEKGLTPKKLRKYHYMFGMPYFDEPYELGEFPSHQAAVEAVEKGLAAKRGGVSKVYRLDLDPNTTLFGVSISGDAVDEKAGEKFQMGVVDFGELKKTAYLPYEVLVLGNKVEAPHMKFRMAVHFPDLSMMGEHSFMKVKSSPALVEKALKQMVGQ
ncbi:MAG TPA: hypothetical protein ENK62_04510 [Chromatiales bacterium]|nr:hypothetical protein [Chromatiales bacterium]